MTEVSAAVHAPPNDHDDGSWRRAPASLWREVSGGVLVTPKGSHDPLLLSGAGWVVWQLLAEPMGFRETCRAIATDQGIDLETTETQLALLLDQMLALGLLIRVPVP